MVFGNTNIKKFYQILPVGIQKQISAFFEYCNRDCLIKIKT